MLHGIARVVSTVGGDASNAPYYRDAVLSIPTALLLLYSQLPIIGYLAGEAIGAAVPRAFIAVGLGIAVALLSPFWRGVVAGALLFSAVRWALVLAVTGELVALGMIVLCGACVYGLVVRGPDTRDYHEAGRILAERYPSSPNRLQKIAAALILLTIAPAVALFAQSLVRATGLTSRYYPPDLAKWALLAALAAAMLAVVLPGRVRTAMIVMVLINAGSIGLALTLYPGEEGAQLDADWRMPRNG